MARVAALVAEGTLNDKLARQVIDAVLAGEGDPEGIVRARNLAVVSDDSALRAAVDKKGRRQGRPFPHSSPDQNTGLPSAVISVAQVFSIWLTTEFGSGT